MDKNQKIFLNSLTSGRSLARNTVLNLIGTCLPMVIGIGTIPILIRHLGTDRFGIITIVWMLIGYFSLFDMGIGRALTQLVANKIGNNELDDIPIIFWTSMTIMLMFAILGAIVIALLAMPLVYGILKVPEFLKDETVSALRIMALSIPFVIINAGLVGFLTAYHRFDIINAIRIPMGIFSFIAPLIVLPFSKSLVPIVSSLIFFRVLIFFVHLHYCFLIVPDIQMKFVIQKSMVKPLFQFGGWMTVTNIVGPIMIYFDRLLIGSIISVSAVAYYTTPFELISKLLIIPGSLLSVLFPAFTSIYAQNVGLAANLFGRAIKFLLLSLFPIILIIVAFAYSGMNLWLGEAFASKSYRVVQWLAIGIFVNSLAQVPFAFLQGIGKPDITSKIHLIELILYLPLLWFMVSWIGIEGAAIAWCTRVVVDTVSLFCISRCFYKPHVALSIGPIICIFMLVSVLFVFMVIANSHFKFFAVISTILLFCTIAWKVILSTEERVLILHKLRLL